MNTEDSISRAKAYADLEGILIDFNSPLGMGEEGVVWKTNRNSAIKVFDRSKNFDREIE